MIPMGQLVRVVASVMSYDAWKASSIGKHMFNAKTFSENRDSDYAELEKAIDTFVVDITCRGGQCKLEEGDRGIRNYFQMRNDSIRAVYGKLHYFTTLAISKHQGVLVLCPRFATAQHRFSDQS